MLALRGSGRAGSLGTSAQYPNCPQLVKDGRSIRARWLQGALFAARQPVFQGSAGQRRAGPSLRRDAREARDRAGRKRKRNGSCFADRAGGGRFAGQMLRWRKRVAGERAFNRLARCPLRRETVSNGHNGDIVGHTLRERRSAGRRHKVRRKGQKLGRCAGAWRSSSQLSGRRVPGHVVFARQRKPRDEHCRHKTQK